MGIKKGEWCKGGNHKFADVGSIKRRCPECNRRLTVSADNKIPPHKIKGRKRKRGRG